MMAAMTSPFRRSLQERVLSISFGTTGIRCALAVRSTVVLKLVGD